MSEEIQNTQKPKERAERIKKIKKIIAILVFLLLLLPTILCILLFGKMNRLEEQLNQLLQVRLTQMQQIKENEKLAAKNSEEEAIKVEKRKEEAIAEENKSLEEANKHKVYLTFDDGPSIYTDEILDILKEYDIKATFFVTGKEEPQYARMYRRIVEEGHTLGIHTFSHKYWEMYDSKDAFIADFEKIRNFLYQTTGVMPTTMRFPGGSSNKVSSVDMQELIAYIEEEGITYYDWNVASGDSSKSNLPAQTILNNCLGQMKGKNTSIILMHDAKDKRSTVEALPLIIEKILEQENTAILPITEDTKTIQHITKKEN